MNIARGRIAEMAAPRPVLGVESGGLRLAGLGPVHKKEKRLLTEETASFRSPATYRAAALKVFHSCLAKGVVLVTGPNKYSSVKDKPAWVNKWSGQRRSAALFQKSLTRQGGKRQEDILSEEYLEQLDASTAEALEAEYGGTRTSMEVTAHTDPSLLDLLLHDDRHRH